MDVDALHGMCCGCVVTYNTYTTHPVQCINSHVSNKEEHHHYNILTNSTSPSSPIKYLLRRARDFSVPLDRNPNLEDNWSASSTPVEIDRDR